MISIVIPTYNRAHLIHSSIESVIEQTFDDWELIIVDDGSSDNTEEVVRSYSTKDNRIIYIPREINLVNGANTCRNIGFSVANGAFIKWLDSDDILESTCLKKQMTVMQQEYADVCFANAGYFKTDSERFKSLDKLWSKALHANKLPDELVFGKLRWPIMSGLWHRSIIPLKPFEEGLMNSQEWLFHIKMTMNPKLKITYVDEVLSYVRVHDESMSNRLHKRGKYYYHEARARHLAIRFLASQRPDSYKDMIAHLLKKFSWFHAFTLYKGGVVEFFKLFRCYPKILSVLFN